MILLTDLIYTRKKRARIKTVNTNLSANNFNDNELFFYCFDVEHFGAAQSFNPAETFDFAFHTAQSFHSSYQRVACAEKSSDTSLSPP